MDGDTLTYSWTISSKPENSAAALTIATSVSPTLTADKFGTYVVSLTVNDGTVNSAADTVTITTSNSAPVANAGPDQTPYVTETVTLNGAGSTDVDGDLLTYTWAFTTIPPDSNATLSDVHAVNPTFTVDKAGTYVVSLIVNDGTVDSQPDAVTVSTLNSAPVASAGQDQLITVIGTTVSLDGTQSYDLEGDSLTYQWSFVFAPDGSSASLVNADTATPTFEADIRGDYVIQLIVRDASLQSAPDAVTVSFNNIRPIAHAGTSQSAVVGDTVTLDGSGSTDANGDSLTYQWTLVTVPVGSQFAIADSTATTTTFVPDVAGTYVVQLVVNDGDLDSNPNTIQVEVVTGQTVAIIAVQDSETVVVSVDTDAFKNDTMQNALLNKLNAAIANIEAGNYADVLAQLKNDILKKTDGCATSGAPDKNDWITTCPEQGSVYPSILVAIDAVEALMQ